MNLSLRKIALVFSAIGLSLQVLGQGVPPYKDLIDKEQSQKALEMIKQYAMQNAALPESNYYLGHALINSKKLEEASEIFQKGIRETPKEALNYAGYAQALFLEGKGAEAETNIAKALELSKSKNALVLASVAEAYLAEGKQADKAVKLLEKANELSPKNAEFLTLMGDAYLLQNNGGLAVSSYEKALSANPAYAKASYKVGKVYVRSKNYIVAEEAFLKAIQIDPNFTLAYKELGEMYYMSKKADKAVEMYKQYLGLTENPKLGKMRYAFFLFMAKEYSKANEVFEELAVDDPNNPLLLRFWAYAQFESGEAMKSKDTFQKYFSLAQPDETEAADFTYYAKVFLKLGRDYDSLAIGQLKNSLVKDPNQPDVIQLLAETFSSAKRYNECVDTYKKLIPIRKKPLTQDYYNLGKALYSAERYAEADTAFQFVINLQPEMTVGYLWQARAKSNLDPETETGLAKSTYEVLAQKAAADPVKYKKELVEAYSYLGYYHFLKNEMPVSKEFWQKVLEIDAANSKAQEALNALK